MAEDLLGLEFAVHGGGSDLVFPHHENEAAQTDAARGRPLVMTSSNSRRAPTRSHSSRSPSRNPGSGATKPMLAAIGSTQTTATESSSCGTTLYGAMTVSATAPGVTPAESGA